MGQQRLPAEAGGGRDGVKMAVLLPIRAFLTLEHPGIKKSSKQVVSHDLRQMLIDQLRR
jgi:hypothetical protein